MSRLKQERAHKLMQDYYVVGSSNDLPSPLWHRRHRRWVQPDARLITAVSVYPQKWIADLVTVTWDEGMDHQDVTVQTYTVNEPMIHDAVVDEFIEEHLKMAKGKDNIAMVGWLLRVHDKPLSPEDLMNIMR